MLNEKVKMNKQYNLEGERKSRQNLASIVSRGKIIGKIMMEE